MKTQKRLEGKEYHETMQEMECWSVVNHLKKCNKHLKKELAKQRQEIIEKLKKIRVEHKDSCWKVKDENNVCDCGMEDFNQALALAIESII